MGLFDRPEVVILKESSDAKAYLEKLEKLQGEIKNNKELAEKVEREIAITKAGIIGEDQILFELKNSGMDLVVLHDIYIEDPAGNGAQIDFLVITPYASVFIECKNLFGNIEINNKGDFIRTMQFGKKFQKEGIYSPITQNERHMRVYKERVIARKGMIMGALFGKNFERYHQSLVVLANPKTVVNDRYAPAAVKKQVIRGDQLINALRNIKTDIKSTKKEMLEFGERVLAMNIEERKDYFAKFAQLQEESEVSTEVESDSTPELKPIEEAQETAKPQENKESVENKKPAEKKICPRCGSELVLRTAKKGDNAGNQFWGCSAFPKCRYVENIR